ncbi:MAG: DUF6677 family protein [Candidatus Aminicenantales bacterium]
MKKKAVLCLILGWFVPGLGHVAAKKFWRGAIFFICILAMTALGILIGGEIYPFPNFLKKIFKFLPAIPMDNPLTILAFFADLGNGLIFILSKFFALATGDLRRATFEYGTAYIAGAGLLNYLIALDAFDIALGRKK